MQVAGACVVAKTRPGPQDLFKVSRCEGLYRRPLGKEPTVIWCDRLDRRLLQHDFGQPDTVGVRAMACLRAPRQDARVSVVPGEKIGGLRQEYFLPRRRSDCYAHDA